MIMFGKVEDKREAKKQRAAAREELRRAKRLNKIRVSEGMSQTLSDYQMDRSMSPELRRYLGFADR